MDGYSTENTWGGREDCFQSKKCAAGGGGELRVSSLLNRKDWLLGKLLSSQLTGARIPVEVGKGGRLLSRCLSGVSSWDYYRLSCCAYKDFGIGLGCRANAIGCV